MFPGEVPGPRRHPSSSPSALEPTAPEALVNGELVSQREYRGLTFIVGWLTAFTGG